MFTPKCDKHLISQTKKENKTKQHKLLILNYTYF